MASGFPSRSEDQLSADERRQLADAHAELREAARAYEPLSGGELHQGEPIAVVSAKELQDAQDRVDAAEEHLWELRERLLGWSRPTWAPRASLVSDWFSDDDAIYDQLTDSARP